VTAQHFHAVVDAVVSIDDQVAALTDLSTMEFSATTTAFGADLPGKDANPWISRHRVSSNSMTTSLPEPSRQHPGVVFWTSDGGEALPCLWTFCRHSG
jgi:hypothetical protein